jgi:hypothetical protein
VLSAWVHVAVLAHEATRTTTAAAASAASAASAPAARAASRPAPAASYPTADERLCACVSRSLSDKTGPAPRRAEA